MATPNGKKPPQRETLPFLIRERRERNEAIVNATGPFIVVYGSVGGGYEFVGPFTEVSQAIDFAEMYLSVYHWEIAALQNPEEVKRG